MTPGERAASSNGGGGVPVVDICTGTVLKVNARQYLMFKVEPSGALAPMTRKSAKSAVGWSFTATMISPRSRPALAAPDPGSTTLTKTPTVGAEARAALTGSTASTLKPMMPRGRLATLQPFSYQTWLAATLRASPALTSKGSCTEAL